MKKSIAIIVATLVIGTNSTSAMVEEGPTTAAPPKTVCQLLRELSDNVSEMEKKMDAVSDMVGQRLDEMSVRVDLLSRKVMVLGRDVSKLTSTVGSFSSPRVAVAPTLSVSGEERGFIPIDIRTQELSMLGDRHAPIARWTSPPVKSSWESRIQRSE